MKDSGNFGDGLRMSGESVAGGDDFLAGGAIEMG